MFSYIVCKSTESTAVYAAGTVRSTTSSVAEACCCLVRTLISPVRICPVLHSDSALDFTDGGAMVDLDLFS